MTDWKEELFKDIGYDVSIPAAPTVQPPELPAASEPEPPPVHPPATLTPQRMTTMSNKPVYVIGGIVLCLICAICTFTIPALQAPSVLTEPIRGDPEYGWVFWVVLIIGLAVIAWILSVTRKKDE